MIILENIKTVLYDLPQGIKGYTLHKDGFYTIVLNSKLSHEQNKKTYLHEMFHIENGDFDNTNSVGLIELYAHKEGL